MDVSLLTFLHQFVSIKDHQSLKIYIADREKKVNQSLDDFEAVGSGNHALPQDREENIPRTNAWEILL